MAIGLVSTFLLSACSAETAVIPERFFTEIDALENTDSLATWQAGSGEQRWLIATAKATHRLVVSDGENGFTVQKYGKQGAAQGDFDRPNGIAVVGDLLFIVERDNRRVQAFALPEFRSLGTFGETELVKPYGIYARPVEDGSVQVYVTDDYAIVPEPDKPLREGGQRKRIKVYEVTGSGADFSASLTASFGSHEGVGALHVVESIHGDSEHDVLLIADEDPASGMKIKVFDMEGHDTGRVLGEGVFEYQPEGIALWDRGEGTGAWICSDQGKQHTIFRVFDRESLDYLGSFRGRYTANTDGICLDARPIGNYPHGLFYAVHDDAGSAGWDLAEIEAMFFR